MTLIKTHMWYNPKTQTIPFLQFKLSVELTPTLPKPSVFVSTKCFQGIEKRYLKDLSQLLYNVVCRSWGCLFCKRKTGKTFLPIDFLCCCFCINVLLFRACCNFGVVTGCDSHRASTCHVKKKVSQCPKIFLFLKKKQHFPWMTTNEINQITLHFDLGIVDFHFSGKFTL